MRQNETVESVCLVLLHVNQVASESFWGPVAKTLLPVRGPGSISGWGTRPHMPQLKNSNNNNSSLC